VNESLVFTLAFPLSAGSKLNNIGNPTLTANKALGQLAELNSFATHSPKVRPVTAFVFNKLLNAGNCLSANWKTSADIL
jgi:hypothetical protein